jgi:predicted transcriptional regulator
MMTTVVVHLLEEQTMPKPAGSLTAAQHEILDVVWNTKKSGATVTEIWHAIGVRREVTRTTVLNQVDRLEKRGWLRRQEHSDGIRYVATRTREQAAKALVEEFVDSFFAGSANALVTSLLGSKKVKSTDIVRLRALLDERLVRRHSQD